MRAVLAVALAAMVAGAFAAGEIDRVKIKSCSG